MNARHDNQLQFEVQKARHGRIVLTHPSDWLIVVMGLIGWIAFVVLLLDGNLV
jgi:hypothetical protein